MVDRRVVFSSTTRLFPQLVLVSPNGRHGWRASEASRGALLPLLLLLHGTMFYVMCCFAGYTCIGRHLEGEGPLFEPLVFLLIRHWSSPFSLAAWLPSRRALCYRRQRPGPHPAMRLRWRVRNPLLFIYGLRATTRPMRHALSH